MPPSIPRFDRFAACARVLSYQLAVDGEQHGLLPWAKARVGFRGLGDAGGPRVSRLVDHDVAERAGEGARLYREQLLGSGDRIGRWRRLLAYPLRHGGGGHPERAGQAASGHAGVIESLLQRFPKGSPLFGRCHSIDAPLGVVFRAQACPIGHRYVDDGASCWLTIESYQATVARVAELLARYRDCTSNEEHPHDTC